MVVTRVRPLPQSTIPINLDLVVEVVVAVVASVLIAVRNGFKVVILFISVFDSILFR